MATPHRSRLAAVALAIVALAIGACSDTTGADGPVGTNAVELPPSYRFAPASIDVVAGATVTWTNRDHFTHSVQFSADGLPSEPQVMEPGQSVEVTFTAPGTYDYVCHLHPRDMSGTVTVRS